MQARPEPVTARASAPANLRGRFLVHMLDASQTERGVTGVTAALTGDDIPTRADCRPMRHMGRVMVFLMKPR